MRSVTISAAAVLAATLLTACADTADPATTATEASTAASTATTDTPTTGEPATGEPATGEPTTGAVTVGVADTDLGEVLVDADGMTLYVFDSDDVDTSACTDGCLDTWPPLLADEVVAGEGVTAELGTFTRDDGDVQATVGGLPLYRYATDAGPGDTVGQGVGDVWWVVDPAGAAIRGVTDDAGTGSEAPYGEPAY